MANVPADPRTVPELLASTWMARRIKRVLEDHPALTMEGWDELNSPSRYTPALFSDLRSELLGARGFAHIVATLVSLAFVEIPEYAPADWVVQFTGRITGREVELGAAIAAALVIGYQPLRDNVGPSCGFVWRGLP